MPFVQVNDVKLHYEMEGSGPPLLMIAGTGLPGATWRTGPSAQYAAEGFTVITFDHRGTGGSDKPDADYSTRMFAADAAGLLQELDKLPRLYDLIEQNLLTYIVDIQDNDPERGAPRGMKKPFSRMRVVKYKDLFAKGCSELGTHHPLKVSVHPLISSFHRYFCVSVSADTRLHF